MSNLYQNRKESIAIVTKNCHYGQNIAKRGINNRKLHCMNDIHTNLSSRSDRGKILQQFWQWSMIQKT